MQNVKQVSMLNLLTTGFIAILSMVLLFSCSKDSNETLAQQEPWGNSSDEFSRAQVYNHSETLSYHNTEYVPCANGGSGELLSLSGSFKIVDQVIVNGNDFVLTYHTTLQGVNGQGLTTGETYVASGGNEVSVTGEFDFNGQFTRTFVSQFRVIGQNTVFNVRYKSKVTITPDGKVTTDIYEEEVDCI